MPAVVTVTPVTAPLATVADPKARTQVVPLIVQGGAPNVTEGAVVYPAPPAVTATELTVLKVPVSGVMLVLVANAVVPPVVVGALKVAVGLTVYPAPGLVTLTEAAG